MTRSESNPLKSKLVLNILKNLLRTAEKTQFFTIRKISQLVVFENHRKCVNTKLRVVDG